MKNQYVGDINDYKKYALLRTLGAGGQNKIGVCWMLTPSDGSADGNKLAYLRQPDRHRQLDPELFDILVGAVNAPDWRRLRTIEDSNAVPGASYFNETLTDDVAERLEFMRRCGEALDDSELMFFDPDNGLEVSSKPKGRKDSSKFLYLDEAGQFYGAGKSLLIYQHFPRIERSAFVRSCLARIQSVAQDAIFWTFATSHVVFLLAVHPDSPSRLALAATNACEKIDAKFIAGTFHGTLDN